MYNPTQRFFFFEIDFLTQVTADMLRDIQRAADVIKNAKAIVVTAGAGMGVDSGTRC